MLQFGHIVDLGIVALKTSLSTDGRFFMHLMPYTLHILLTKKIKINNKGPFSRKE